jgi:hypothetical protein
MSLQPFNTLSQYNNTLFKAPDLLVLNRMLSFAFIFIFASTFATQQLLKV